MTPGLAGRLGRQNWLFHRKGGAVKHQLIHALERRGIQRIAKGGIAGGKGRGNILIMQLPEMAVIKIYILHMAIRAADNFGHLRRGSMKIAEINIPDGFAQVVFADPNMHRIAVIAVDHNIGKAHIFNQSVLIALIAHAPGIGIAGQVHSNAMAGFRNIQVGKGAVAHNTIIDPAYPHAAGMAGEVAVGNAHFFTNGIFLKGGRVCPHHDAVIPAGDIAIGNGHLLAAIDMDAVVIGHIHRRPDIGTVKVHVPAAADPIAPSGRLVAHAYVLYQHMLTPHKEHHPGRGQAGGSWIQRMRRNAHHGGGFIYGRASFRQRHGLAGVRHIGPLADLLFRHGHHIFLALAIDHAPARNADIPAIFRIDKAALIKAREKIFFSKKP